MPEIAPAATPERPSAAVLGRRADDQPESIKTRLREYAAKTEPLLSYYRQRGLLLSIDASPAPDAIFAKVQEVVRSLGAGAASA